MGDKSRDEEREWTRSFVNPFREKGSIGEWSVHLGAVARILGVSPTPPTSSGLRETRLYRDSSAESRGCAIFPRKSRRPLASVSGIHDEARARELLHDQCRTGVQDPQWFHQESVDRIGFIAARLFRKTGCCRLSLSVGPAVASQLCETWNIATDRRITTK